MIDRRQFGRLSALLLAFRPARAAFAAAPAAGPLPTIVASTRPRIVLADGWVLRADDLQDIARRAD